MLKTFQIKFLFYCFDKQQASFGLGDLASFCSNALTCDETKMTSRCALLMTVCQCVIEAFSKCFCNRSCRCLCFRCHTEACDSECLRFDTGLRRAVSQPFPHNHPQQQGELPPLQDIASTEPQAGDDKETSTETVSPRSFRRVPESEGWLRRLWRKMRS